MGEIKLLGPSQAESKLFWVFVILAGTDIITKKPRDKIPSTIKA